MQCFFANSIRISIEITFDIGSDYAVDYAVDNGNTCVFVKKPKKFWFFFLNSHPGSVPGVGIEPPTTVRKDCVLASELKNSRQQSGNLLNIKDISYLITRNIVHNTNRVIITRQQP